MFVFQYSLHPATHIDNPISHTEITRLRAIIQMLLKRLAATGGGPELQEIARDMATLGDATPTAEGGRGCIGDPNSGGKGVVAGSGADHFALGELVDLRSDYTRLQQQLAHVQDALLLSHEEKKRLLDAVFNFRDDSRDEDSVGASDDDDEGSAEVRRARDQYEAYLEFGELYPGQCDFQGSPMRREKVAVSIQFKVLQAQAEEIERRREALVATGGWVRKLVRE